MTNTLAATHFGDRAGLPEPVSDTAVPVGAPVSARSRKNWATWKTFMTGLMSEHHRQRRSDQSSALAALRPASNNYSRTKSGKRADLGEVFFRSSWEANYARYLNLLMRMNVVESWEFEPETFWFHEIKRGTRSYLPDFRVKYRSDPRPVYVEIKGWLDARSKTKITRFRKYYPQHKLEFVGKKEYYAIRNKWGSSIPAWESGRREA